MQLRYNARYFIERLCILVRIGYECGYLSDCEEGPLPLEVSADDKAKLLSLIQHGVVTGKADCSVSTGGFDVYNFVDPAGNFIGSLAFEDGLLARGDGHYFFEIQK